MTSTHLYAAELRAIRSKFGLTVPDFATFLWTDRRVVNRWEGGSTPIPPGVLDRLHALEDRMRDRIAQRAESLRAQPAPRHVTLYRDRDELVAADPFYEDLPVALHTYEIAQLRDLVDATPVYSDTWIRTHPNRSPYGSSSPMLTGPLGQMRFRDDVDVPDVLRQALDGIMSPGYDERVHDAIAYFYSPADLDIFALAESVDGAVVQPWDTPQAPDVATLRSSWERHSAAGKEPRFLAYLSHGRPGEPEYVFELSALSTSGMLWIWSQTEEAGSRR